MELFISIKKIGGPSLLTSEGQICVLVHYIQNSTGVVFFHDSPYKKNTTHPRSMVDFIVNNQPMVGCKVDYSTLVICSWKWKIQPKSWKILLRVIYTRKNSTQYHANVGLKPTKNIALYYAPSLHYLNQSYLLLITLSIVALQVG